MNDLVALHLLFGPLLLLIGLLFRLFLPKHPNHLYGYRTPKSMKSDETWEAANRHSADRMIGYSLVVIALQLGLLALFGPRTSLLLAAIAVIAEMILIIVSTERYLNRTFDDAGVRRN